MSLPLPRAELPRDTVRPLSECALGAEVPPTCVRPVPPGRSRRSAPHKGDRGSGGRPAPGTGAPPAQPRRLRRGGHAREPLRLPPAAPARAPASGRRVRHCPPVAVPQAGPGPRPLQGVLLSPRQPKRHPERARSGRYPDRQSGGGDVPPPPPPPLAGLQSPASRPARQRRVTCAPRPSPRRSRAPLPRAAAAAGAPPPSASQWVSDAPGPSAKPGSPIAIAFIWPPRPTKRRPDWRDARRAPIQSQGPPGSEAQSQPHAEAPAGLGRAGLAARARGRAGAEGRRRRWKRYAGSLFFRGTHGAFQAGGGPARGDEGPLEPESRAAGGRRTGRGGGNRPEGGTARSRLLAGTAASEFPGRRGGAGPKAKFEPVQNSGVVTVSTAALFSPRAEPRPGPAGERAGGAWTGGPAVPRLPARCALGPRLQPGWSRARSREPPALRCGQRAVPEPSGAPCPLLLSAAAPRPLGPPRIPGPLDFGWSSPQCPCLRNLAQSSVTIISNSSFRAPCSDPSSACSAKHVSTLKIIYQG